MSESFTELVSQISDTSNQVNTRERSSVTRGKEVIFCAEVWGVSRAQMRWEDTKSPA